MNLLVRINLVLGPACVLALIAAGLACRSTLESAGERDLAAQAGLMLDSAVAMRNYTSSEIVPLLQDRLNSEFLPQSVPFYAASQNFLKLREKYRQYSYKEATLNPTNPRDRAADWEADIVRRFRDDAAVHELSGVRDTPMGPSFYMARPIRAEAVCLGCHSIPSAAPPTLVARYGPNNGFGWQADEIVGAQVVSVPFGTLAADLDKAFRHLMLIVAAVLGALWLLINGAIYFTCIRPLRSIAGLADSLSLGESKAGEFPRRGAREITALGASFDRMRKSLDKALRLLGG